MIETGVAWAGDLEKFEPDFKSSWGRATKNPNIFFDVASLTKVIVTSSLLAEFCIQEKLKILDFRDKKASFYLGSLPEELGDITIGELWDHRSGLKPHFLLNTNNDRTCFSGNRHQMWEYIEERIVSEGKRGDPGIETVYSDLNYWVLGAILEKVLKKDLNHLWDDFKKKYGLPKDDLFFGPLLVNVDVVPTETKNSDGEVNDDNALFMQQVAPHAGLFATANGVWQWLLLMKNWHVNNKIPHFFIPAHAERFWCGWDRPTGQNTQAGTGAPPASTIGHLGYTGTAIWWDPKSLWGGVLLTNRVYPSHSEASVEEIRHLRVNFFSLLWQNNRRDLWKNLVTQNSWT